MMVVHWTLCVKIIPLLRKKKRDRNSVKKPSVPAWEDPKHADNIIHTLVRRHDAERLAASCNTYC